VKDTYTMLETKANVRSKLLTIQQVAAMTNITPRQLRYWERYGIIKPKMVTRGERKDRRYSLRDVAVLKKSLQLRKKKISVRKVSKIIRNPSLHFDSKAIKMEQKFFRDRPQLIKEALEALRLQISKEIQVLDAHKDRDVESNNSYIALVNKIEQIDALISELNID